MPHGPQRGEAESQTEKLGQSGSVKKLRHEATNGVVCDEETLKAMATGMVGALAQLLEHEGEIELIFQEPIIKIICWHMTKPRIFFCNSLLAPFSALWSAVWRDSNLCCCDRSLLHYH